MFVNHYSFGALKATGFGLFNQLGLNTVKNVKAAPPELGRVQMMDELFKSSSSAGMFAYSTRLSNLESFQIRRCECTPITPTHQDLKFGEVSEGTLQTGVTFVIQDNAVLCSNFPGTVLGNHPVIEDIVGIANDAAQNKKQKNLLGKAGWFYLDDLT